MNILLSGGRAPATLDLARAFHRAGHRVFMAESFRAHISQPSNAITKNFFVPSPRYQTKAFIQALRNIIVDNKINLFIPTGEEIFYAAMERNELPCAVFSESITKLNQLHSKWSFVISAMANDLPAPETMLIRSKDDLFHAYAQWRELVLKPVYSRFASQTMILPPLKLALSTLKFDPAIPWVAQGYTSGKHYSTYSICHHGHITAHAAYPATFKIGLGTVVAFQHIEHPAMFKWVKTFVEKNKFTGQIGFDFIEKADGQLVALECNPRTTSGAHLLASNPKFTEAFYNPHQQCATPINHRPLMLAIGMLIHGLPAALQKKQFKTWLETFLSSDDVILDYKDPRPALLQFRRFFTLLSIAWKNRISPFEARTFDVEWNGDEKRG